MSGAHNIRLYLYYFNIGYSRKKEKGGVQTQPKPGWFLLPVVYMEK